MHADATPPPSRVFCVRALVGGGIPCPLTVSSVYSGLSVGTCASVALLQSTHAEAVPPPQEEDLSC